MSKNYTDKSAIKNAIIAASNSAAANDIPGNTALRSTAVHVEKALIPTVQETLSPTYPDSEKGFQPLSDYLVEHITQRVMRHMKALCKQRHIALDLTYWEQQTRFILSSKNIKGTLVISSPAGSGKSTWIEAFAMTLMELFQDEKALETALVGLTIVLQKVEDLNRLAGVLNADTPPDSPRMVALQGWSTSGQRHGFCQNPSVNSFDECTPRQCSFTQSCELYAFHRQAPMAPIIGLTQERFTMLRDNNNLDQALCRLCPDGSLRHRRYLIFDEKFQMAQIFTLDKSCIDHASIKFSTFINKIGATDSQVRSLQQKLSYYIERPFQDLRRSLRIETQDIQAGLCKLPPKYVDSAERMAFHSFCDLIFHQKKQYATKELRTALTVMGALFNGEQCLFSKTNGFAISYIIPPLAHYGACQSIIFDATAEVDEDYHSLSNARFSKGTPKRKQCYLNLHIYQHKDLNVSKQAMNKPWKIPALSQFIAELVNHTNGQVFLCCYKDFAETMADSLKKDLCGKNYGRILSMPDREHDMVPYFGGTNGSNSFNTATEVFMLGYPRLNPKDYLIYTSAAYGVGQVADELMVIGEENLLSKKPDLLWTIPSVKTYMAHHLAARLEQEIYRCALRNPDFTDEINVYLFCPPPDMLEILCVRLNPTQVIYHDKLPACVDVCKRSARSYKGQPTQYGRLVQFLETWNGSKISVQQIQADLKISRAVWKDLMKDNRVKELLAQQQIQREGHGSNAYWYMVKQKQCA